MIERSLTIHLREIVDLKRRLRVVECTLAVVLAYLVVEAAVRVIL
jgi:hypothetical protein